MNPKSICLRLPTVLWLVCLFLILPAPLSAADAATPAPREVVRQWLRLYPQDLPGAATLTTAAMRGGLSKTAWADKHETVMDQLQFQYLDATILHEDIDAHRASLRVKVRLSLVIGEVVQIETYTLRRIHNSWLIDHQEITDDRVIGQSL